jgi:hypothetical protein
MNAIAVAVSKLPQWFSAHMFRSLSIKTVMPADEHAAPKVSAAVIYQETNDDHGIRSHTVKAHINTCYDKPKMQACAIKMQFHSVVIVQEHILLHCKITWLIISHD